jgi:hypothetical protein
MCEAAAMGATKTRVMKKKAFFFEKMNQKTFARQVGGGGSLPPTK